MVVTMTTPHREEFPFSMTNIELSVIYCIAGERICFFSEYYSKIHIKLEDTNVVIRSGRWKNLRLWSKENDKNTKLSTKHYTENERLSSTKPTMKPG